MEDKKVAEDSLSRDHSLQIKQMSLTFISAGVVCSILSFGGTYVLYHFEPDRQPAATDAASIPSGLYASRFSDKKNDPATHLPQNFKPGHKNLPGKETPLADKTSWIFHVNEPGGGQDGFQQFFKHLNEIQVIHLYGYELTTENKLPTLNQEMKNLLSTVQMKGIPVYPTVNTGGSPGRLHQLISSPEKRNQMVDEWVKLIQTDRFDGINLHVDSISETDRESFALFVENLSKPLHQQGKKISLSIALQSETLKNPGLDLGRLGKTCDEIKIVSSAYSAIRSEPVQSFQLLDQILSYTKTKVPASKIYIDLPAADHILSSKTDQVQQTVRPPQKHNAGSPHQRDHAGKADTKLKGPDPVQTESMKKKITFIKENHPDIGGIYQDISAPVEESLDALHDLLPSQ